MSEDHARFAPSAAHRWLNCTASVAAASRYPDFPGEAAMEGAAAHFLLERCLVENGAPLDHLGREIVVREKGVERRFVVTREMATDVLLAVETIHQTLRVTGVYEVEQPVGLSHIAPGMFGTPDLQHFGVDQVLTIVDFKYGRSDVAVEYNEQLLLYASGAFKNVAPSYNYLINLVIVQPRSVAPTPRVKTWSFPSSDLDAFENRARAQIWGAENDPNYCAGPWCRHCPALGECPATEANKELAVSLLSADMTVRDAARILERKDLLEKIVARAEKVMLDALLAGYENPNFPLVTKTKHRQWRDADLARQRIVEEIGAQALEPPTPSQAEKLGKAGKEIAAELAFTPPGEPTIGRSDDKRAKYLPKSAEKMFPANGETK